MLKRIESSIISLISILDLFHITRSTILPSSLALASFNFIHALNLGKARFAKWTGIFPFRPFFNASKTEIVIASIQFREFRRSWFLEADATIIVWIGILGRSFIARFALG